MKDIGAIPGMDKGVIRAGVENISTTWIIPLNWPIPSPTIPPYPDKGSHGYVYLMNNGQQLSNGQYSPIMFPDPAQNFRQATITIYSLQSIISATYGPYDPSYTQSWALFNLWSVDINGNDIEKVISNANMWEFGQTPGAGYIHGNKYWSSISQPLKYIAGFRGESWNSNQAGLLQISVTVQNPMVAWISALS